MIMVVLVAALVEEDIHYTFCQVVVVNDDIGDGRGSGGGGNQISFC